MINTAKQLNEKLKESQEAKEYFLLKEKLKEDKYVSSLLQTISLTQKEAKEHLANNDINNYKIKVAVLETLKQEFINHPLVNNYIVIKQQLHDTLKQIVDIISE